MKNFLIINMQNFKTSIIMQSFIMILCLFIVSCSKQNDTPAPKFKSPIPDEVITPDPNCFNRIDQIFNTTYKYVWNPYNANIAAYNIKVKFTNDTMFTYGDIIKKDKLIWDKNYNSVEVIKLDTSGPFDYYDDNIWTYKIYKCGDSIELFNSKEKFAVYVK